MRFPRLSVFFWSFAFCASVCSLSRAGPVPGSTGEHTWKPMADWSRPDLRAPKLAPRTVEQSELRLQRGDDARWAAPDWDDGLWETIDRDRVPFKAGIFWLRLRTRTMGRDESLPRQATAGGISAWECYWDGALVCARGSPGTTAETEIKGDKANIDLSAVQAAPGEHVIALRVSTFNSPRGKDGLTWMYLWTIPPEQFRALDQRSNLLSAMGVGAMLTLALGVFVMWVFADRRLVLALFSALCLSAALLIAVAGAPMMWDSSPLPWTIQIPLHIGLVIVVSNLLIAVTWVQLHPLRSRRWLLIPLLLVIVLATWLYGKIRVNALTLILWRISFLTGLAFVAGAIWRRNQGGWFVLAGIGATYAMFERHPKHFEHTDFFLGFLPVLVGLIAAIALRLRSERLQARDTKLMAARLEIELLRKSLQPHFMMNTLTALSQVIEEKPAAAVKLIDDLAVEFRSLARFSGQKQVSLSEELALCRAHLGVVSVRTDQVWNLEAEGIDVTALVPPALFLTLIENGFSHQRASKDATTFTLRAERMEAGVRYVFVSPGAVTSDSDRPSGGTGLRYVCARLEESFHDAWKLSHGAVPGGWETVIELLSHRGKRAVT
ncbi:MAG: histidine kinase [Opitutus sp.]